MQVDEVSCLTPDTDQRLVPLRPFGAIGVKYLEYKTGVKGETGNNESTRGIP